MSEVEKGVLLDTHTWIWLFGGSEELSQTTLLGDFHGDPADKIIVATARIEDLILLTRDKKILSYGEEKYLHCLKI